MVRRADIPDVQALLEIREAYYAARQAPVQLRTDVDWWVAEIDGDVVAVQGYQDVAGQRVITDTYCRPTRSGKLGLSQLVSKCHLRADSERIVLVGMTEPDNVTNQRAMEKRGYVLVAYTYARLPCQQ
jgi:N-acetylglutamate synthase-like GNAT family acetyltransferase